MIYHVLVFKFFDTATPADRRHAIAELRRLGELSELQVRGWLVGEQTFDNPKAWDFFQFSLFDDMNHLQRYREHPEHKRVRAVLASVSDWHAVDYADPSRGTVSTDTKNRVTESLPRTDLGNLKM